MTLPKSHNKGAVPCISVVILNLNGRKHLEECLRSVSTVDYPSNKLEVIVVDNGSTDGSVESAMSKFPQVRFIKLRSNFGFCLPNNIGARVSSGEYVFFLNNDATLERDALQELASATRRYDDSVSAFSPKISYYDNRRIINAAGATLSIVGFGFYIGDGDVDSEAYSSEEHVGFACGAAALVKRSDFLGLGGFDPEYFASAEEAELGFKIWLSGKKVLYVPSARIYHKVSGTYGKRGPTPAKVYLQTRNRLLNMFKFMTPGNLLLGTLLSTGLDFERLVGYLRSKQSSCALSVLYAYVEAMRTIRQRAFKRKRSAMQSLGKAKNGIPGTNKIMASVSECVKMELRRHRILKGEFFTKDM